MLLRTARLRATLVFAAAAAMIGGLADPASAATVDFLSISAPESVDLGAAAPGEVANGTLGETTVTGAATEATEWTVDISVTPFTGRSTRAVIPAEAFAYTATDLEGNGMVTLVFDDEVNTVTATGVSGESSASWSAEVALTIPPDALADTYTATITASAP